MIACVVILVPLAVVFTHLNFSFHRRSWEKSRLEAQRNAAHGSFDKSAELYRYALQDAERFPINPLMLATTFREAADSAANLKDYTQARTYFEKSRDLISKYGVDDDRDWLSLKFACLSGLGRVEYDLSPGDYQSAEAVLTAALPLYAKLLKINPRLPDDLIAGDALIHDTICLASIYSIHGEDAKATALVADAQKLLLKFPVDGSSRNVLVRLAQKFKVEPPEEVEISGLE